MKSDHQLKQDVMEELAWEPSVNETEIGVEVKDGIVTLSGHLSSFAEKYGAERATQRVAGVKGLAVEIDIVLPGASERNDTELARTALHMLEWNSLVPKDAISVMVESGWISLTGTVEHNYQRLAAENGLRHLVGVKGIMNHISIKPSSMSQDVKSKIEAALQRRAHNETRAIEVSVAGDEVTLTGSVPSMDERRAAVQAASAAPGVAKVIDQLTVA